ncbi:uncharacterized protein GVI51_K12419 [Nakaseomyces glabratus]|uniref:Uncharacterized protein n=1 Tax=Candida glabrata (strain ATCC 2001 / BCRC 20586 / JCM 3761 / NBRC 0622 / NRRL Y-65 / CBS 138) TaxID=284593 RepID=Q6FLY1_CANGA|nr:uncharacterized protein CAGL0K12584g [Nakaseomyces glabratus]KAH7597331.1 Protein of unknown function (DUF726) [Nakaseomyces glabratus]KAH7603103.1 Protein of unknown function (DUF726) [Nakaseomyces glabratus]QHS68429.1 uncharacterized protein GVI51_K12419 [Nakaseomyces glabratus]CAG61726.1 unnamed protein product [Nakaseomyces glabratus]|eukprot:XP_448763.1 uncharacterized protein CAGL0K12584g [[Candida] glabrata]
MSDQEDLGLALKGLKISKRVASGGNQNIESEQIGLGIDYSESKSQDDAQKSSDDEHNDISDDEIDFGYIPMNEVVSASTSDDDSDGSSSDSHIDGDNDEYDSSNSGNRNTTITGPYGVEGVVNTPETPSLSDITPISHETNNSESDSSDDGTWQEMPTISSYNIYGQKGEVELSNLDSVENHSTATTVTNDSKQKVFAYTKIAGEQQAQRSYVTNTKTDFLFDHKRLKKINDSSMSLSHKSSTVSLQSKEDYDEFEDGIDPIDDINPEAQLNVTKLLLNDMEKFAYAAAVNVLVNQLCTDLATLCLCVDIKSHKKLAKRLQFTQKDMAAWKTVTLQRLYDHLEISDEEIKMLEKVSLHKLKLDDLCKCLKTTQNIENPWEHKTSNSENEGDDSVNYNDNSSSVTNNENNESVSSQNVTSKLSQNTAIDDSTAKVPNNRENVKTPAGPVNSAINEESLDFIQKNSSISIVEPDNEMKSNDNDNRTTAPNKVINPENISDRDKLNVDVAWTIICDLFLVLLQNSTYDSRSRTLLIKFAEALKITKIEVCEFEKRVTDSLDLEQSTDDQVWDEQDHMKDRRKKRKRRKMAYVGLAMVGGSLVLGLSGGLLAPVIGAGIAAGLSTIGVTGATGFLTGVGGTTIVALSSTAIGANIGARGMSKRMGSVRTFEFLPLHNNRRVNLIINVSGWMVGNDDDVRLPFSTVDPVEGDLFSLYWEPEMLKSMGQTIGIVASEVFTQTIQQVLGATILTGLMSAIQLPMALSKLGYILDNPWNVSLDRAWSAGLILADTLIGRNLGERPVTLIGFSLGARVILSCLVELCRKNALGIVENVFIFGTPVVNKKDQLVMARSVVSGRFVNCYSDIDWLLAYLFRATAGGFRSIMGISPVEGIEGIDNYNCTEIVDGHLSYRSNMPKLLKKLGIAVLSEEFAEIEETVDPDEFKRKRKLINDVDAAQKKLSEKKKSNGWVSKWLKPKKSKWQTMVEEAVEEGRDISESPSHEAKIKKKKDGAIVDHGALLHELEVLKAAMKAEREKQGSSEELNTQSLPSDVVALESEKTNSDNLHLNADTFPNLAPKSPQTPNSFQLLSAGKTILPDDDPAAHLKKNVEYSFPDDI